MTGPWTGKSYSSGSMLSAMIEVEVKARVADLDAARARVEAEGGRFLGEATKRDLYYGPGGKRPQDVDLARDAVFRLRNDGIGADDRWHVTAKVRELEDGVEVNREIEFPLAAEAAAGFRELAQYLGFRPFIVKRKVARRYALSLEDGTEATVELCRVDPVGDFVEVELLLDDSASTAAVKAAQGAVRALLTRRLLVPAAAIEPRHYNDLLRARGAGRPDPGR